VITAVFLLVGVSIDVIRPHMIFTVTMIAADVPAAMLLTVAADDIGKTAE